MPRVKRGTTHVKSRRKILKKTKGYSAGRKKLIKQAKTAINKAGVYAYRDRRVKKRVARTTWQIKINAAVREYDMSYSKFIAALNKHKIGLDRKILAEIAENNPEIFAKIVAEVKK